MLAHESCSCSAHIRCTPWRVSPLCHPLLTLAKRGNLPALIHGTAARVQEDSDDPITAEYDVFLTPALQEQIYLLQYPNRNRARPYNMRQGVPPVAVRIKPETGYFELDINMSTNHNFNKYQGLKWGDAMQTSREVHNDSATYGLAAGFSGAKPRSASRNLIKDKADREMTIYNDLNDFGNAEAEDKVMHKQTLGGQIMRHDGPEEAGKPLYFVGAFRDDQLHLTKVNGTVQMRPQFHHIDAEEQRARLAASRAAMEAEPRGPGDPRSLLMKNKTAEEAEKNRLEDRTRRALQAAEAETWVGLDYVDEDEEDAYEKFHQRMFVRDVDAAPKLQSGMDNEQYLDAISAPRRESPTRRRKRAPRRKEAVEEEREDMDGEAETGAG